MITNSDAPSIDLVDDGVHHAVRRTQFLEVTALRQPAMEPRNPQCCSQNPLLLRVNPLSSVTLWTLGCLIGPNGEILKVFRDMRCVVPSMWLVATSLVIRSLAMYQECDSERSGLSFVFIAIEGQHLESGQTESYTVSPRGVAESTHLVLHGAHNTPASLAGAPGLSGSCAACGTRSVFTAHVLRRYESSRCRGRMLGSCDRWKSRPMRATFRDSFASPHDRLSKFLRRPVPGSAGRIPNLPSGNSSRLDPAGRCRTSVTAQAPGD